MDRPSVAIIGSFKQYYTNILTHVKIFRDHNINVTTPTGSSILKNNIPFVRFESDSKNHSDEMIQTLTLMKIFNSDVVYAVCPNGYIGKTTCYEIGRIIQRNQPLYFSCAPEDIPIKIPSSHVITSNELCNIIFSKKLSSLFKSNDTEYMNAERRLLQAIVK